MQWQDHAIILGVKRLGETSGGLFDGLTFGLRRFRTKHTRSLISRSGHQGLLKATKRSAPQARNGILLLRTRTIIIDRTVRSTYVWSR